MTYSPAAPYGLRPDGSHPLDDCTSEQLAYLDRYGMATPEVHGPDFAHIGYEYLRRKAWVSGAPDRALAGLRELRHEQDSATAREAELVAAARDAGVPWRDIAAALGRATATVVNRHGKGAPARSA